MSQQKHLIAERIESFLRNPDGGTLTGERRMSTESLLDMLADRISEDGSANVICIKEKEGFLTQVRSKIAAEKKNHILLYADVDPAESALVKELYPKAQLYRAKELCHQVPVCFKEPAADNGGPVCEKPS